MEHLQADHCLPVGFSVSSVLEQSERCDTTASLQAVLDYSWFTALYNNCLRCVLSLARNFNWWTSCLVPIALRAMMLSLDGCAGKVSKTFYPHPDDSPCKLTR